MAAPSQKPIVFVFGTQKGDVAGRKRNLSAINTQVAYRAHEKRREKKNRQRALAKDNDAPTTDNGESLPVKRSHVSAADLSGSDHVEESSAGTQQRSWPEAPSSRHSLSLPSSSNPATNAHLKLPLPRGTIPASGADFRRSSCDQSSISDGSEKESNVAEIWSLTSNSGRNSSPATDQSLNSPAVMPINNYLHNTLDPFFKLPKPVTGRERWLVHFYFAEMGHIGFGTHVNALFCPDRDWVSSYVSSQSMCLQWILIHAESHLRRIGVESDPLDTVARKTSVYGQLGKTLQARQVDHDEGISGIMFAAILDMPNTNMHLQALDRQIKAMGGFEGFLHRPSGLVSPEHIATVYAFGQCPILSIAELDSTTRRFMTVLRLLSSVARHEQVEIKRLRNRRPWDNLCRQIVDANGTLVPATGDEHFKYYLSARQDCLECETMTAIINIPLDTADWYANQARHLAVLIQLHLILYEFKDSYLAKAMFLKRLKHVAECSTARDARTGATQLTAAGLLLINSYVRQEIQSHVDGTKMMSRGIRISSALVDALKINPLLSDTSRARVVGWLREWMCHNDRIEGQYLTDVDGNALSTLSAEISQSWITSGMSSVRRDAPRAG